MVIPHCNIVMLGTPRQWPLFNTVLSCIAHLSGVVAVLLLHELDVVGAEWSTVNLVRAGLLTTVSDHCANLFHVVRRYIETSECELAHNIVRKYEECYSYQL
jgi:hypothetical protein